MQALADMTGLSWALCPPQLVTDMLAAIVESQPSLTAAQSDTALMLDTRLDLATQPCALSFLLIPLAGSITSLLEPLGLAEG
jgi:chemotaxis protein CheY-P-specific phosphatase CheC